MNYLAWVFFLGFTGLTIVPAAAADLRDCVPTSREKGFWVGTQHIFDGNNNHVSTLYDVQVRMIEQRYADCRIRTDYVVDMKVNNWDTKNGSTSLYLSTWGMSGEIDRDAIRVPVPRGFCTPGGYPNARPHQARGSLRNNYFDAAASWQGRTTRISGRQTQCSGGIP